MRRLWSIATLLIATVPLVHAQAKPREFEVASVRESKGPYNVAQRFSIAGPTVTLEVYTSFELIQDIFDIKLYQVFFPAAVMAVTGDTRYTIQVKAEGDEPLSKNEARGMLQELLASRFNLKFHHEIRETDVYALMQGKGPTKLIESNPNTPESGSHGVRGRNSTMTLTHVSMDGLADQLFFYVDRPIVDKTGLTGSYDIKFEATPAFRMTNNPQPEDLSAFTAVQDMLGLRLEPQKAQVGVIVIDRLDKPTEN